MIRCLDFIFALIGLIFSFPILLLIFAIGVIDTGSPLFIQQRVGRHKKPFTLLKFRTMKPETESVATHLVSGSSTTPLGRFLRSAKLDELPQLWNVLVGDMSFVGPRPCLFNQIEVIEERQERGVLNVRPGITGLAQINQIDMSTPKLLAETDQKMLSEFSICNYFYYIFMTIRGKGVGDRVRY